MFTSCFCEIISEDVKHYYKYFQWFCAAEQLRSALRSLQGWEGPASFTMSTPGCRGAQRARQGGEVAASPDKVYHESQRGLGKAPASVCANAGITSSLTHAQRILVIICQMKAGVSSCNWRLVTRGQGLTKCRAEARR